MDFKKQFLVPEYQGLADWVINSVCFILNSRQGRLVAVVSILEIIAVAGVKMKILVVGYRFNQFRVVATFNSGGESLPSPVVAVRRSSSGTAGVLIVDGFDVHVPKGYIYFAMAFSVAVEILNMRVRARRHARAIQLSKAMSE